jgi:hypothetical protein
VWERRGEYRRVEEKRGKVRKQMDVPLQQPVALQSMRAYVNHLTTVSVDLISTSTTMDIGPGLATTTFLTSN